MKNYLVYLFVFFLSANIFAQNDSIPVINTAFEPGEYLKYKVKYAVVGGGYAELKIQTKQIGYDWYYHVIALMRTTGVVGKIASVYDRYESFIEIGGGFPLLAIRDINEGNYRRYNEVIFARDEGKVISLKSGEHSVPGGTLDVLSAFYYARRVIFDKPLEKNQVINLTSWFDDELYTIQIKYKEREKVNTKFGKIWCLKFVPILDERSKIKKEDDFEVWFSDDGNFIPVKIRLKVGFGKMKCDLDSYKNLKNPFGIPYQR
jgi:hypothetical protein